MEDAHIARIRGASSRASSPDSSSRPDDKLAAARGRLKPLNPAGAVATTIDAAAAQREKEALAAIEALDIAEAAKKKAAALAAAKMAEERKAAGKDPNPRQPISPSERVVLGKKEQSTSARNANGAKIVPPKPNPAPPPASTRIPIFGSAVGSNTPPLSKTEIIRQFIEGLPNAPPPHAEVITESPEEEALKAIENEDIRRAMLDLKKNRPTTAKQSASDMASRTGAIAGVKRPVSGPSLVVAGPAAAAAAAPSTVSMSEQQKTAQARYNALPQAVRDAMEKKKQHPTPAAADSKPILLNVGTLERSPASQVPVVEAAPAAAAAAAASTASVIEKGDSPLNVGTLERSPPGPAPAAAEGVEPLNLKHTNLERSPDSLVPPLQTSSPLMTGQSMSNPIISPRNPGGSAGGSKKRTSGVKRKNTVKKNKKNAPHPKKATKKIVKYPKKRKFTIKIR
jgi:hypothetical protein